MMKLLVLILALVWLAGCASKESDRAGATDESTYSVSADEPMAPTSDESAMDAGSASGEEAAPRKSTKKKKASSKKKSKKKSF